MSSHEIESFPTAFCLVPRKKKTCFEIWKPFSQHTVIKVAPMAKISRRISCFVSSTKTSYCPKCSRESNSSFWLAQAHQMSAVPTKNGPMNSSWTPQNKNSSRTYQHCSQWPKPKPHRQLPRLRSTGCQGKLPKALQRKQDALCIVTM